MTTELLATKYAKLFANVDRDGDGYAGLNDILDLGTRVLTAFAVSPATATGKSYLDALKTHWDVLTSNSQPDALGRITLEQFQEAAEAVYASAGGYDQVVVPLVEATLGILDSDGDGVVGATEFTTLLQAVGTSPPDQISMAFQALDPDGSGSMTADQLRIATREFFTSTEPDAPGNMIFGPI
jgi:Ca2+-binding EF-hand superfamily protein